MDTFEVKYSKDGLGEIRQDSNYICLVTDSSVENYLEGANVFQECEKAHSLGCNMYAMVKKGTVKPETILTEYKWSGIYYFDKDSELGSCARNMKRDIYSRERGK